ncbi:MerR family transcriptional regulator [Gordonia phthalatica]|uniref:MerR family transcriptional regulator n=1 Tax=Gordonia phthalatica TaxID=1136941 RepID=A0A0N9MVD7_9ACTN|nr:MerR family transcriptional regulator [Gordonia phthalatica]ALG86659.1 MerR family transcriptional regulator [Gordonia phthalatica]
MSTSQVAESVGCSVQQVRDLEALGVIAPAMRRDNGYRGFDAVHVRDLVAYRALAKAVGPVESRAVMRRIRVSSTEEAVVLIADLHLTLRREIDRVEAARCALRAIESEPDDGAAGGAADELTITDLATALGVRASTLRFWEQEGLVAPVRVRTAAGSARRYPTAAIRQARITAVLRAAGHRIPDIRAALRALDDLGEASASHAALDARRADLTARLLSLMRAAGVLADIVAECATSPG